MGSNESAAIMAATASHAVGLQTHGIVSIRHGGTMLFKVIACTGAFNAGALVEWVRQTTGSLMVEDVYNAALSVGFGNKEDLVVQEAGGTKAFYDSLEPDARFDDFRLFLDPWRHPQIDVEDGFVVEVVDLLPDSEVLERCQALGYQSVEAADQHQRYMAKTGNKAYLHWVLALGQTLKTGPGIMALGAFQFQKGSGRRVVFPNGQIAEIDTQGNFKTLLYVSKFERAALFENVTAEEGQHNFDWECSVKATGSPQVANPKTRIIGPLDDQFDVVLFEGNVLPLPHRLIEPTAIVNPCL